MARDLRLVSTANDVNDIPREGESLIIVAVVDHLLHFRIFDDDGVMVVNTNEKRLTEQSQQVEDLRKQLENLWPLRKLTKSAKVQVIAAVTSIIGHTRTENQRMNLLAFHERTTTQRAVNEKASSKSKQKNADLDELA